MRRSSIDVAYEMTEPDPNAPKRALSYPGPRGRLLDADAKFL